MKKIILFAAVFIAAIASNNVTAKAILTGKITDAKTGLPIPGVSVYFPDLKTGTTSTMDGIYRIENLPQTTVTVHVSFIGYKTIIQQIDLKTISEKNFEMEATVAELNQVVVTDLSHSTEKNKTPTPITTITPIQLRQISATNIINALASQPGISELTTGAGISKPVIRGLGYNRVVVVNDGIRQEGQQWGDEHGIEIDEYSVNRVEILKGPASLAYGSDAMAGVINMLSAPTLPQGKIAGSAIVNYQTNNGLIGASLNVAGNQKGFIWDIRYSNKSAHAFKNRYDGYVFNSSFKENSIGGIFGLNKSWGYVHMHVSAYLLQPGIIEGDRDSATGKFLKPVAENDTTEDEIIATQSDFTSYKNGIPFQDIFHYKAVVNNSFILRNGSLKTIFGWQQNRRKEFANVLNKNEYELYFYTNTYTYDVRYLFPEKKKYNFSVGANGMLQHTQNKGVEFLIPDYNLFDAGVFAIASKSFNKIFFSTGIRYDLRNTKGNELWLNSDDKKTNEPDSLSTKLFQLFDLNYSGISGSVGASYPISKTVFTKLNISKGFRAPNIAELASNGVHEGTVNYETGNLKLKAESSLQFDFALGLNTDHVTAETNLFYNSINNYIYTQKLSSTNGGDSITNEYSTYKFNAGDASIYGGEISFDIHPHPLDWLHLENSFSYVRSIQKKQPDSLRYLPFAPAPKLISEIKADIRKLGRHLVNAYVKVAVENYFKKKNVRTAFDTETATPGYTLFNFGCGADVVVKSKKSCSVFVSINNVTDVAYQSHLSRLKYTAPNNATGRRGIYNMGRNISIKIIVPVGIKN